MSQSRNSNSVQSQTEMVTDEESSDDDDQSKNASKDGEKTRDSDDEQSVRTSASKSILLSDSESESQSNSESESESSSPCSSDDGEDLDDISGDNCDDHISSDEEEDGENNGNDGNNDDDGDNQDADDEDDDESLVQSNCKNGSNSLTMSSVSSTTAKATTTTTNKCCNSKQSQVQCNNNNVSDVKCNRFPVKPWMSLGTNVLVRWIDGLYYLGVIEKIEEDTGVCLIRYEDDSMYWTHFKDVLTQISPNNIISESDIVCSVCSDGTSKSPNEIVICDVCNQGYHQFCHKPMIPDSVLEPDAPWSCRFCIYALGAREGGAERDTAIGKAMKQTKTVLPYDLDSLTWNADHQANRENTYCYCTGPGRYHSRMLRCHNCLQWFHEACIQVIDTPFLYGDHFYKFICGVCNNGSEVVERLTMKWSEMIAIVLNNLTLRHQRRFFDLSSEIVPFIMKNSTKFKTRGDSLRKMREEEITRKVLEVLVKYRKKFTCNRDQRKKLDSWALRVPFPFPKPLFFAPRSFYSRISEQSSQLPPTAVGATTTTNNPSCVDSSGQNRSRSPPPFPLIYGACRKGASIYPKPAMRQLVRHRDKKKTGRKPNESRDSTCQPGTSAGASEPNNLDKSSTSMQIATSPVSNKAKTRPDKQNKPRAKRLKSNSSRQCSTEEEDNDDSNSSSSSVADEGFEPSAVNVCLEKVIPLPENFEGQNNPFFDINEKNKGKQSNSTARAGGGGESSRASSLNHSESGYQIISSGTCSKLTLKRITGQPTDKGSPKVSKPIEESNEGEPKSDDNPRKCTIKAQRLTADGKLEYLFEWE